MADSRIIIAKAPTRHPKTATFAEVLARKINEIINVISGTVSIPFSLRANQTTTTVVHAKIHADCHISLMPKTATAGAENYHIVPAEGQATITHSNAASTDRTFVAKISP